jgi:hypothetical protein
MSKLPEADPQQYVFLSLPEEATRPVQQGKWWVMQAGNTYLAVYPLGKLAIDEANAAAKTPAMLRVAGRETGYILETADTSRFPTIKDFLNYLKTIKVSEEDTGDVRKVTVQTPGGALRAVYDRKAETFLERSFNKTPYTPGAFTCPRAMLGTQGSATVGNTTVTCTPPQPESFTAGICRFGVAMAT